MTISRDKVRRGSKADDSISSDIPPFFDNHLRWIQ
jgi:hypothetical protein